MVELGSIEEGVCLGSLAEFHRPAGLTAKWSRWKSCTVPCSDSSLRNLIFLWKGPGTLAPPAAWSASCSLQPWSLFNDYPETISECFSVSVCRDKTEMRMRDPTSRKSRSSWSSDYQFITCPCLLACLLTRSQNNMTWRIIHLLPAGTMVWEQEDGWGVLSPLLGTKEVLSQQPLLCRPCCEQCTLLPTSPAGSWGRVWSPGADIWYYHKCSQARALWAMLFPGSISRCPTEVSSSTLLGSTKKIRKVIKSWTHISLQCTYIGTESQNCLFWEIRDCVGISPNAN